LAESGPLGRRRADVERSVADVLSAWGWRIHFLFGGVVAGAALALLALWRTPETSGMPLR
jgi:hypothetical protein